MKQEKNRLNNCRIKIHIKQMKYMKMFHKTNQGFSLVELIVVIAIMTIVTAGALLGFNVINSGNASKAVKTISGEISTLRTNTLSKTGDWSLEIANDNGKYILNMNCWTVDDVGKDQMQNVETTTLGSRIDIRYWQSGINVKDKLSNNMKLVIAFERESGKVAGIKLTDKDDTDKPTFPSNPTNSYFGMSACGKHHGSEESFAIFYETGKVVTDYQSWK